MEEVDEGEVYAAKEYAQTDSGLSSPVSKMDSIDGKQEMTVAEHLGEERASVEIPTTIAMWGNETTGNTSLIERVMEAESRATSPTDAGEYSPDQEESDDEPTVEVSDRTEREAATSATVTNELNAAAAPTSAGANSTIPATIAMWDDEKQPSPPRPSADDRFARLKASYTSRCNISSIPHIFKPLAKKESQKCACVPAACPQRADSFPRSFLRPLFTPA